MKAKKKIQLLCGLLVAGIGATGPARADAVTDWNEIALTAITAGRTGGPIAIVDVALVQVAVHDAVQAIDGRFEPYYAEVPGARGRRSAAVAACAHDLLVGMFPLQVTTLDAAYFDYLAAKGLNGDPGLAVGRAVAAAILPLRRANPDPLPPPFVGGTTAGTWRPTDSLLGSPPLPPPFAPMAAPWMAKFDPFTLTGPARFRAPPPPPLASARYARDYDEVKAMGSLDSAVRNSAQTDIAYFYSENFVSQWNRALRGIAIQRLRNTGDSARLFALANLAAADAIITTWEGKVTYATWRPITAIRAGDADGNPATAGDPAWQPLINTPNYPDYPSGANYLTPAFTRTLALFFGTDRVTFEVTTQAPQAVRKTRVYTRFSAAADDVVNARVWLGIHFRFADVAARAQGTRIADWTFGHFLLPLRGADCRHCGRDWQEIPDGD
jgi:hypothetical protein